ncbi:calcineurin B [Pelomyxa schiedti]|nr:calcineurin B [Pelomyxa schiedti]
MGNKPAREPPLSKRQLQQYTQTTHFSEAEVTALYHHYKRISSSIQRDGVIDQNEFRQALGAGVNSVFVDRIFTIFDSNHDSLLSFDEFVHGLSGFCDRANRDEKLELSFRVYDIDGDGYISKEELMSMLRASLVNLGALHLSEDQIIRVLDATFSEVDINHDGRISFEEYKLMVLRNPIILENLTVQSKAIAKMPP